MANAPNTDARINFRLPRELKEVIEEAATAMGQSISEYAISTLVQNSQRVLQDRQVTVLSSRDRKIFMAALDDVDTRPNAALRAAAQKYKKRFKA